MEFARWSRLGRFTRMEAAGSTAEQMRRVECGTTMVGMHGKRTGPDLQQTVRRLADAHAIRIHWHARLEESPPVLVAGPGLTDRVEGMMLGLAIGDALGNTSESLMPLQRRERYGWIDSYLPNRHADDRAVGLPSDDSQLAFWTLEHLLQCSGLDPARLGELFVSRRHAIFHGGQTTREALDKLQREGDWTRSGCSRSTNGALMRIAPILLPHVLQPSPALWTDTLAAAHLTHDDALSNSSCLALVDLLWRLLGASEVPQRDWWLSHWIEVDTDIGSREGRIKELLTGFVRPALAQDLQVEEAGEIWHSGMDLLQTVPSVLYILARHGHGARAAIEAAVNGTRDNDTIAALVGAAVGALHGARALPQEWVDGLLGRTRSDDDGQVFRLLAAAGEAFGYGVSEWLRRRLAQRG